MKCFIVVLFLVSIAFGQTVINAVPAPANASGLCWAGGYLWCGAYGTNGDTIWKINPTNGTVVKKFKWHSNSNADCYGLAFDTIGGGSLWVSCHYTPTTLGDSIYLIDTITGARLNAIHANKTYMAGLANDGQYLWHCCYSSPDGRVYHINKTTGAPFDSINIPTLPQPWGATWDGQYLWVCNDSWTSGNGFNRAYKIDVITKQIIDSVQSPGRSPRGLAWDGQYLWITALGTPGRWLYQIDLGGGGTPDIQISPTTYDYNNVPIGQSPQLALMISNVGTDTLTLDTIFSLNPVFHYQTTTFPIQLRPNFSVQVQVYFSPTAFQLYTGSMGIVSDDPDEETVYVALRGQGVYPLPTLSPSASSHDYGDVRMNCVKDWFLRIVNQGYPVLRIDSIKYTDERFFSGRLTLPISLNCLETTYIQVITRPNSLGNYNGDMQVYSNSTPNPYIIQLSANGIPNSATGGQLLWEYDFPDNVVCVAPILNAVAESVFVEVAAEAYGTDMYGKKHLKVFRANSSGTGVVRWAIGDTSFTGSWGDDCLIRGDDYNNDDVPDILLGTAWGDRSVYAINTVNGQILWFYDSHVYDGEGGWVYSVRPMPDINGDGIGEVLAGIGGNQSPGGGPRSMYCFSGANGTIIWQFRALDAIGSVNWIPDINNDGVTDAICSAWGNSLDKRVYCVSGASSGLTSSYLWQFQCGADVQSVITIPDLNGDNKLEVVAGAWNGMVYCLSGANGSQIWTSNVGGWVVKVVAIPDLISQNRPGIAVANVSNVTAFNVLNSNNGSVYWSYVTGSNVWTVDVIDDLNGDNKMDVITGNQTPGNVYCLSGANGNLIWSYSEARLIYSVRAIRDISGDGHQDVLVGTQGSITGIGHVLALCGGNYPPGVVEQSSKIMKKVSIYPHISRNNFNISFDKEMIDNVAIFDASGRLVKTFDELRGKTDRIIWSGDDNNNRAVARGVYFVKISSENHSQIEKLIVIR